MKVLHIVNALGIGGAELLLMQTVQGLEANGIHNIILSFAIDSDFVSKFDLKSPIICLKLKNSFWGKIKELEEVFIREKPDIIHSNLYKSTLLTRLANRRLHIKHVFSIHSNYEKDLFKASSKSFYTRYLEQWTYSPKQLLLAVSQEALDVYKQYIDLKGGSAVVLSNFISDVYFETANRKIDYNIPINSFVSVGNLKAAKNFHFLIEVFAQLKNDGFTLDIYGEGTLRESLELKIKELEAFNVTLKGGSHSLHTELKHYDAFISASTHEGFGLVVAEAMAIGLPLYLSDLNVFREVSGNLAIFFDPYNRPCLKNIIKENCSKINSQELDGARSFVKKKYSSSFYIEKILCIYNNLLIC